MTDREKAIVMAYTGTCMLSGDKFQIFHKYVEDIIGRSVSTHELADKYVQDEIKKKAKADFIALCEEQGSCVDAVSRQAVIDKKILIELPDGQSFYSIDPNDIICMPRVTPVACIATVKINKEDMQELVDEKVKELKAMIDNRITCKDCVYNVKNGKNTTIQTMCAIGHRSFTRDHNTFYCADAERRE